MHFNLFPWEISVNFGQNFKVQLNQTYLLQCDDPFIERILTSKFSHQLEKEGGPRPTVLLATEINVAWLENQFSHPGLFSTPEFFLVLNAQQLSLEVKKYLIQNDLVNSICGIFFSFSKKSPIFNDLKKAKKGIVIEIKKPRFWETNKLFDFYLSEFNLNLNSKIKSLILNHLSGESSEIVGPLKNLRLHIKSGKELNPLIISEIFGRGKVDKFYLGDLFSEKKKELFFKKILDLNLGFSEIIEVGQFLQSHLLKLADYHYLNGKNGVLNKYEKGLLKNGPLWAKDELKTELDFFSNLQILAKKQDPFLRGLITDRYLKEQLNFSGLSS